MALQEMQCSDEVTIWVNSLKYSNRILIFKVVLHIKVESVPCHHHKKYPETHPSLNGHMLLLEITLVIIYII